MSTFTDSVYSLRWGFCWKYNLKICVPVSNFSFCYLDRAFWRAKCLIWMKSTKLCWCQDLCLTLNPLPITVLPYYSLFLPYYSSSSFSFVLCIFYPWFITSINKPSSIPQVFPSAPSANSTLTSCPQHSDEFWPVSCCSRFPESLFSPVLLCVFCTSRYTVPYFSVTGTFPNSCFPLLCVWALP